MSVPQTGMQITVRNIVSGRNNSATVSTVKKLWDGLGTAMDAFFHCARFANLEQEIKQDCPGVGCQFPGFCFSVRLRRNE